MNEFISLADKTLATRLGYKINFDVVRRTININSKKIIIYYLSSLVSNDLVNDILESIYRDNFICNGSIDIENDINIVELKINSGMMAILYFDEDKYKVIDIRNYPNRSSVEPESEKSLKGSHDGFTEHMLINTALIRRRIKTRDFRCELLNIGELSKTYVNLYYIENRVNKKVYQEIKNLLNNLKIDSLVMADRALAELLFKQTFNVFPVVRFSERPDIVAISILQGYLVIMVDNSPSAIIVPTTFFELNQQPMEYHFSPIISSATRLLRYFCILISLFLIPLWLLVAMNKDLTIPFLIYSQNASNVSLFIQILIVQIFLSLIRLASFNTPGILATSMSLAATIILSEVGANIGIVSPEIVFYCCLSSIANFSIPSFEVSRALTIWNFIIIIAVGLFYKIGFIVSVFLLFLSLVCVRNFHSAYLYPFIPFNLKDLINSLIRLSNDSKYTTKVK